VTVRALLSPCPLHPRPNSQHQIGVEFGSRIVPVGPKISHSSPTSPPQQQQQQKQPQKHMKLSLWDTAGQETYKSVTRSYFRGASGALLVFDITRRDTFIHAIDWLHDLRQIAEDGIVIVLVGNKSDLAASGEDSRAVSASEAETWCHQNGIMAYVETSAKSGEGVEKAFLEVADRIYENIEKGRYDLNDRRSGVKSAGAGGRATRTVNLGMSGGTAAGNGRCC
jgi:Ras-related protein Rab-2A